MVKQGHIVNSEGKVSNQLDIIIFDRLNTPKFFETSNETVFYPIESVLAIGEIKKTLRENDLTEFRKKIKYLKKDMNRKLIPNTVYGGKIQNNSSFSDIVNMRTDKKYKNPLFSFIFAIDVDNYDNLNFDDDCNYMPNDVYILNYGYLLYGDFENNVIKTKLEDEFPNMNNWLKIEKPGMICLAMLLSQLINHLNNCHIEPFSISNYMSNVHDFGVKGSEIKIFTINKD